MSDDVLPLRSMTKSARLLLLYKLRQQGQLQYHSQAEIARRLGVHRSTILRDLVALDNIEPVLDHVMDLWRT